MTKSRMCLSAALEARPVEAAELTSSIIAVPISTFRFFSNLCNSHNSHRMPCSSSSWYFLTNLRFLSPLRACSTSNESFAKSAKAFRAILLGCRTRKKTGIEVPVSSCVPFLAVGALFGLAGFLSVLFHSLPPNSANFKELCRHETVILPLSPVFFRLQR